jgi:hypothetical protein
VRTTVAIDDDLLAMAKRRALERRTTLGAVIEDALRVVLFGGKAAGTRPFKLVTFRGDGPVSGVDLDHTSGLMAAEDEERYGRR